MLSSETCGWCGKAKERRRAFCLNCYLWLPSVMQRGLWRRIGSGFEEAYACAVKWMGQQRALSAAEWGEKA